MKNKTMIVTGASSGLGKELALHFAGSGFTVCALARNEGKLLELKKGKEDGIEIFPCNITDSKSVEATVSKIYNRFQGIDVLINNAAVFQLKPFAEQSMETIDHLIDTNLKGTMYCTKAVIDKMIPAKRGRIINISSVAGTWGMPGQAVYCASKHGVVGFGDALAQELLEHGILLTTICPGGIDTPLWRSGENIYPGDMDRLMKPKELADLISYVLAQPETTLLKKAILFPVNEWHAG